MRRQGATVLSRYPATATMLTPRMLCVNLRTDSHGPCAHGSEVDGSRLEQAHLHKWLPLARGEADLLRSTPGSVSSGCLAGSTMPHGSGSPRPQADSGGCGRLQKGVSRLGWYFSNRQEPYTLITTREIFKRDRPRQVRLQRLGLLQHDYHVSSSDSC